MTIARWCGVHTRLFKRLSEGKGCRVDTYNEALRGFSARWPDDLEWPRNIPRPISTAANLANRLIEVAVRDDMIDAILDDGGDV